MKNGPPGPFIAAYRSFMLEQLSSEYITTARVKGLSERAVIWRHALGNIKVQLITVIALDPIIHSMQSVWNWIFLS